MPSIRLIPPVLVVIPLLNRIKTPPLLPRLSPLYRLPRQDYISKNKQINSKPVHCKVLQLKVIPFPVIRFNRLRILKMHLLIVPLMILSRYNPVDLKILASKSSDNRLLEGPKHKTTLVHKIIN